jgi:hypothetical protein
MAKSKLFKAGASEKVCTKCGQAKPRTEYNKCRGKERAYCKVCHSKEVAHWAHKNRERRREYARNWAAKNQDKIRAYPKRGWHDLSQATRDKKSAYAKKRHLERKYGITQKQWQQMFDRQGGVCALCRIPGRVGRHGKLAVDHCHNTGRVRGLLCAACNVSLGNLGDDVAGLMRALAYVAGPRE